MWDIKKGDTLREVKELHEIALTFYGDEHLPAFVIFANKAEMEIKTKSAEYLNCIEWCEKQCVDCFKTSSITGHNLEDGLSRLVQLMTKRDPVSRVKKSVVINQIGENNNNNNNDQKLCCKQ